MVVAIGLLAISLPEAALAQVNFDDPKCYGGRVDADSVTGGFRAYYRGVLKCRGGTWYGSIYDRARSRSVWIWDQDGGGRAATPP